MGRVFIIEVPSSFRYMLQRRQNAAWNCFCLRFSPMRTYSPHPVFKGPLSINIKKMTASVFHFRKEDCVANDNFYTVIVQTYWSSLYKNWSRLLFLFINYTINNLWRDIPLKITIDTILNLSYPLLLGVIVYRKRSMVVCIGVISAAARSSLREKECEDIQNWLKPHPQSHNVMGACWISSQIVGFLTIL